MANAKHTPGPWVIDANGDVTSAQGSIAWLPDEPTRPKRNASLIAAAPALLDALKNADELLGQLMPGVKHIVLQDFGFLNQTLLDVRAAIAEAEGVNRE